MHIEQIQHILYAGEYTEKWTFQRHKMTLLMKRLGRIFEVRSTLLKEYLHISQCILDTTIHHQLCFNWHFPQTYTYIYQHHIYFKKYINTMRIHFLWVFDALNITGILHFVPPSPYGFSPSQGDSALVWPGDELWSLDPNPGPHESPVLSCCSGGQGSV